MHGDKCPLAVASPGVHYTVMMLPHGVGFTKFTQLHVVTPYSNAHADRCRTGSSVVPRSHPRGEEKGSGYNTTSRLTLEGRNQHTIVSNHVLT